MDNQELCTRSDAWVLTSLLLIGQTPTTLAQLMAAADVLMHAILTKDEVNHALSILHANGYLQADDNGNISVTDHVELQKNTSFTKAYPYDKIGIAHQYLIQHITAPCTTVNEFFTDADMDKAYREYTKGMRKL